MTKQTKKQVLEGIERTIQVIEEKAPGVRADLAEVANLIRLQNIAWGELNTYGDLTGSEHREMAQYRLRLMATEQRMADSLGRDYNLPLSALCIHLKSPRNS